MTRFVNLYGKLHLNHVICKAHVTLIHVGVEYWQYGRRCCSVSTVSARLQLPEEQRL